MNSKTREYIRKMTPKSKNFTPVSKKLTETINLVEDNVAPSKKDDSIMMYVVGAVVLDILGVNVFLYLGVYTETLADFFRPFFKNVSNFFGYSLTEGTKQTAKVAAKGATAAVDTTSNVAKEVVDITKDATVSSANLVKDLADVEDSDFKMLKKKLGNNKKKYLSPDADVEESEIQKTKSKDKSGYCFVGKSKGVRTCMKVDKDDVCMSGEIFPSRDKCVNPSLRY